MRAVVLFFTAVIGLIGIETDEPPGSVDKDQSAAVERDALVLTAEIDPDFGYIVHVKDLSMQQDESMLCVPITCQLQGKKRELANLDTGLTVMIYNRTLPRGPRSQPIPQGIGKPARGFGAPVGGRIERFKNDGSFQSNVKLVAPGGASQGPPPVSYDGHFVTITVQYANKAKNEVGQPQQENTYFDGILVYPKPSK
jgi:hypothetical protein